MSDNLVNMRRWLARADKTDWEEGQLAYLRYNQTLSNIAEHYEFNLGDVVAAFVALSPNNDYVGNLRSLVTLLGGINKGLRADDIKVSTYKHARDRAYTYASGVEWFDTPNRGLKVSSFYHNILDPADSWWVTVDGHIHAAWLGDKRLTMKEAVVRSRTTYRRVVADLKALAFENYLIPNQLQAILWLTRKRVFRIKAKLQNDLFIPRNDQWRTYYSASSIKPYT